MQLRTICVLASTIGTLAALGCGGSGGFAIIRGDYSGQITYPSIAAKPIFLMINGSTLTGTVTGPNSVSGNIEGTQKLGGKFVGSIGGGVTGSFTFTLVKTGANTCTGSGTFTFNGTTTDATISVSKLPIV